jgi:hypothetical protein
VDIGADQDAHRETGDGSTVLGVLYPRVPSPARPVGAAGYQIRIDGGPSRNSVFELQELRDVAAVKKRFHPFHLT